jgi:hypothetical protein
LSRRLRGTRFRGLTFLSTLNPQLSAIVIELLESRTRPHRYAKRCARVAITTIEPLEARVAPASLTYTDVDGDLVTITTSKGTAADLGTIITKAIGGIGEELRLIDFALNSATRATFAGTNLTIIAKRTSLGGDGLVNAGYIDATDLDLGKVVIRGDLGQIDAGDSNIDTLAVKGLRVQSMGQFGVTTQAIGGSLVSDFHGKVGFLKVAGNVKEASISSDGNIGSVTIGGSLIGGATSGSGEIFTSGAIGVVKIGGNIEGGGADKSGRVSAGALSRITIGGSIFGGVGDDSGTVTTNGPMGRVTIGGSLIGGANNGGWIIAGGAIGPVKIGGNIQGSDADATVITNSGFIMGTRIASLFVGGSIIAGSESGGGILVNSGTVRAFADIGPIVVKGSLIGNSTNSVLITARGQVTPGANSDVAIKSLTVGGRVESADILAGYDNSIEVLGVNADAQIGRVIVGDWIRSNLVAGVQDDSDAVRDDDFGEGDDQKIIGGTDRPGVVSKIASILIKGTAFGSLIGGDHYGFVAQQIGSFKIGTTAFSLTAGAGNDLSGLLVGLTVDLRVREVAL